MACPFTDSVLLGGDAVGIGLVGGTGRFCGNAKVGDRSRESGLFALVELLEPGALFLPVAGFALLDDEQHREREAVTAIPAIPAR